MYAVCVGRIYDEIIKHLSETKPTGKGGCQKPKSATNPYPKEVPSESRTCSRRGKPEPHRQLSDDPEQSPVGRTLPGTPRRKQAAVRPFVGVVTVVGPGYHRALESQRQALCEPFTGQCREVAALPAGEGCRIVRRPGTLRLAGAGPGTAKRKGPAVLPQSAPAQGTQRTVTTRRRIRPDLSEKHTGSWLICRH